VNLFVPSEVSWKGITLTQETDYPESQSSPITIRNANAVQFPLRVRIPAWCKGASLRVNGERQSVSCTPGTWASLDRKWTSGDKVSIELPMELLYAPIDKQHPHRVALVYGPTVLVKRQKHLSADSLAKFVRPENKLRFELSSTGEDEFVPFYSVGFHEPYEMYFDLG
jgi:DUF1680 family protein